MSCNADNRFGHPHNETFRAYEAPLPNTDLGPVATIHLRNDSSWNAWVCTTVRCLGIFGSRVRREHAEHSDLDLLVEFDERPPSLLDFIALENHLSDLLGVKVDLVEKSTLKPAIGRRVLRDVKAV